MSNFQPVIALDKVIPGKPLPAELGDYDILLCRDGDDVFVVEDRCSHMDVKLRSGTLEGRMLTCRAHGARFNVATGEHQCMPAVSGIQTFAARVVDGMVEVALPDFDGADCDVAGGG